jgi:hypothetical protein
MRNPAHEKFSLMAGTLAFMVSLFLFRVNFPGLTPVQKGVLTAHLLAAMALCGIVGGRRLLLGVVVLPLVVLGMTSLTCWWIVSSTP